MMAVSPSSSGPGPNDIPGAVGRQALSTKRNSQIAPFGTAARFTSHSKDDSSPGPGQYEVTAIQAMGSLTTGNPSWSMGKKLENSIYKSLPLDVPGAEYDAHKTVEIGGHMNLSHSAAMDHAPRSNALKDNGVPGPGLYNSSTSLGTQSLSRNRNEPKIHFTKKLRTSDMPHGDPVFISRQHGGDRLGRGSPGPAVHVGRLTSSGASFIGGNLHTSYGSKTRTIGFTKDRKLRPHSTEGFWKYILSKVSSNSHLM